ncbi:protein-cysteine N-palmitoyltransferase HHAT-like [Clytia hemisphaerica]|uniref:Uncharacterized protein n=1 Tax=Clytia hemisphaerica TaxID=252671 RepID=A0A7M5X867_9CNID
MNGFQKIETTLIWSLRIFLCLYPLHVVYRLRKLTYIDGLEDGAPDDHEWYAWREHALPLGIAFSIYSILGRLMSQNFPKYRKVYFILAGALALALLLSTNAVMLFLTHIMFFYIIIRVERRSLMWIYALFMIYTINFKFEIQKDFFVISPQVADIVRFSLLMVYIRCIDYSSSVMEERQENNLTDFLHYMFYLPLFLNGPLMTYKDFQQQNFEIDKFNGKTKESRISEIAKNVITCTTYAACLELFMNHLYTPKVIHQTDLLSTQTGLEALSIAWVHVQLFCIKYIIFFRFSGLFAKIDGFTPPGPPKCVSMTSTFMEMWRTFDRGLYQFLQHCIYYPMGGSKKGLVRQISASFLCFGFVAYWHGATELLFTWGVVNWVGIVLESMAKILVKRFGSEESIRNSVRLRSVILTVPILALIFSNFLFLTGIDTAVQLLTQIFTSWKDIFIVTISLYIVNRSIFDVENYQSRKNF